MIDPAFLATGVGAIGTTVGYLAANLKNKTSGNGNSRSYVEIKDTIQLGVKIDQLVANTTFLSELRNLPRMVDMLQSEIAGVNNTVRDSHLVITKDISMVHKELDALASGVLTIQEKIG